MHFFLQGERGTGKSYLLRQYLQPYLGQMAGFGVSRLMEENEVAGFAVFDVKTGFGPLEQDAGGSADEAVFMYRGSRNVAVLERIIARVEADSRQDWCKLVYLDEIGGIELMSPAFMSSLQQILDGGKPCAGVWKSAANLAHTIRNHSLTGEYRKRHGYLEDQLKTAGALHTFSAGCKDACQTDLADWLRAL